MAHKASHPVDVPQAPTQTGRRRTIVAAAWIHRRLILAAALAVLVSALAAARTQDFGAAGNAAWAATFSTGVLDNFNRPQGSLGPNWDGRTAGYRIAQNQLDVNSGADIYWKASSFGATQEVFVTLVSLNASSGEVDLLLKAQSPSDYGSGLIEVWYSPSARKAQVWTYTSAEGWVQRGADIAVTFASDDQFGARATAAGQVEVYKNGNLLGSRDVTGWPDYALGGYIGLWFINATNTVLDDFGGGTSQPSPSPAPTSTPSVTPAPPTPTLTFTPQPPTATRTVVPPSATATPTGTPTTPSTPTATRTAVPPTATVTATPTPTAGLPTPTLSALFPQTGVLDNFNRANGSPGANWGGGTAGYSVSGNQLAVGTGGDVYWAAGGFGATQEVFVTLTAINSSSTEIDLLLKAQSDTYWGNGLIEASYNPGSGKVQVWTYASAQGWVLCGSGIAAPFAPGDQFGARATAAGQVEVYQNGNLLGIRDVTGWPDYALGGYIGLWFVSATNTVLDDFGGGTSQPSASPAPTTTPASTATRTPMPPTPTSGASNTPTLTPAPPTPTLTVQATATPTPAQSLPAVYFAVGTGSSDVIPHVVVRTQDDRVYLFAGQQYASVLHVYWTTSAGLPGSAADFGGALHQSLPGEPLSLEAVYDGGTIIHVLVIFNSGAVTGTVYDYVFDASRNAFKAPLLVDSDSRTVSGDYLGSVGISGMMDRNGRLNVAYWSSAGHITFGAYTYNSQTNTLAPAGAPQQVDSQGYASHPTLSISPLDGSLTVAWVSQATVPPTILARSRSSAGVWGAIETASAAPAWTSTYFGVSVDQGPSLLIDPAGTRHLTYIQGNDSTGSYGRIHYVINTGSGWTDTALATYSHDPALAINSAGNLYIIGHGHPQSQNTPCLSLDDMCVSKMKPDGTWGSAQLFAKHTTYSFDSSPSVKWSVVGFNRPETVEFVFFSAPIDTPTLYYARLAQP